MILNSKIRTIKWENNVSKMIDQTILPNTYSYVEVKTIDKMYELTNGSVSYQDAVNMYKKSF